MITTSKMRCIVRCFFGILIAISWLIEVLIIQPIKSCFHFICMTILIVCACVFWVYSQRKVLFGNLSEETNAFINSDTPVITHNHTSHFLRT